MSVSNQLQYVQVVCIEQGCGLETKNCGLGFGLEVCGLGLGLALLVLAVCRSSGILLTLEKRPAAVIAWLYWCFGHELHWCSCSRPITWSDLSGTGTQLTSNFQLCVRCFCAQAILTPVERVFGRGRLLMRPRRAARAKLGDKIVFTVLLFVVSKKQCSK